MSIDEGFVLEEACEALVTVAPLEGSWVVNGEIEVEAAVSVEFTGRFRDCVGVSELDGAMDEGFALGEAREVVLVDETVIGRSFEGSCDIDEVALEEACEVVLVDVVEGSEEVEFVADGVADVLNDVTARAWVTAAPV